MTRLLPNMASKLVDISLEIVATVSPRYRRRPTFRLEVPWAGNGHLTVSGVPIESDASNSSSAWTDLGASLLLRSSNTDTSGNDLKSGMRLRAGDVYPFGSGGAAAVLPAPPMSGQEARAASGRFRAALDGSEDANASICGTGQSTFLLSPPMGAAGWERFDCIPTDVLAAEARANQPEEPAEA